MLVNPRRYFPFRFPLPLNAPSEVCESDALMGPPPLTARGVYWMYCTVSCVNACRVASYKSGLVLRLPGTEAAPLRRHLRPLTDWHRYHIHLDTRIHTFSSTSCKLEKRDTAEISRLVRSLRLSLNLTHWTDRTTLRVVPSWTA